MKIRTAGGTPISVNPRCNGGITICQGRGYILLTEDEWHQVAAVVTEILRDYSPSVAATPSHARIQRYVINKPKEHNEPDHIKRHQP